MILALALILGFLPRAALPVDAETIAFENLRYDDYVGRDRSA